MGYRSLISKNVTTAFKLLGDLATEVTFINTDKGDFDFASGSYLAPDAESKTLKVIITDTKTVSANHVAGQKDIIFASNLIEPKAFDSIVWKSEVWKLGPISDDNTGVVTSIIYKEVTK